MGGGADLDNFVPADDLNGREEAFVEHLYVILKAEFSITKKWTTEKGYKRRHRFPSALPLAPDVDCRGASQTAGTSRELT